MEEPAKHLPVCLTSLKLTNFRNYESVELTFAGSLVALTGPNGAGKTNLLEAISLLTPGRGLRRARYGEMARHAGGGEPDGGWAVSAQLLHQGEKVTLGTGTLGRPAGTGGRAVRINGADSKSETLLDFVRILWLTPAMDRLFSGPAGDRRRFLDRLVLAIDPAHARRISALERLQSGRNRLLDDYGDPAWIDAQEAELAPLAWDVSDARTRTVELLREIGISADADEDGFPAANIELVGEFEDLIRNSSRESAISNYISRLAASRDRDRAAGRTLLGPNRSDLKVEFAPKRMPAAKSSTGEQKALLVGLILAHARLVASLTDGPPILLLDEVAAHLDSDRRTALLHELQLLGGQVFMTGTDRRLFASSEHEILHCSVAGGLIVSD